MTFSYLLQQNYPIHIILQKFPLKFFLLILLWFPGEHTKFNFQNLYTDFCYSGLQDQLLALVVMQERPDLEELRSQLVISSAQMKQELKEIQDRILHKLSVSEGSPVDDLEFIITLEASKVKSDDIKV